MDTVGTSTPSIWPRRSWSCVTTCTSLCGLSGLWRSLSQRTPLARLSSAEGPRHRRYLTSSPPPQPTPSPPPLQPRLSPPPLQPTLSPPPLQPTPSPPPLQPRLSPPPLQPTLSPPPLPCPDQPPGRGRSGRKSSGGPRRSAFPPRAGKDANTSPVSAVATQRPENTATGRRRRKQKSLRE
ncbi:chitin-binding lectin 1-like [Hippoglossus hippoglossus]|uniref:chitin-binding lectin 1-like n=1 Tax=Hippoglossus hippoglossus TaxID=8267 RepID=UPI00148CC188|nr:chitin-binding lectin 1-like [Hippoglossus hippoglossus]